MKVFADNAFTQHLELSKSAGSAVGKFPAGSRCQLMSRLCACTLQCVKEMWDRNNEGKPFLGVNKKSLLGHDEKCIQGAEVEGWDLFRIAS